MSAHLRGEFPERPHMSTLSDLLGIQHFSTSRGSTVRRDFLEAVAFALGATGADIASLSKDQVLNLIWVQVWGEDMPDELYSNGATVTNEALAGIVEGVIKFELGPILGDDPSARDFFELEDERRFRIGGQAIRDGQDAFRNAVLSAYSYRCAVTGDNAPVALEAAHIAPYRGSASNSVRNGLCLRVDLHRLFDRFMFAIHEDRMTVVLSPALRATSYALFDGVSVDVPSVLAKRPDRTALYEHRRRAGLA